MSFLDDKRFTMGIWVLSLVLCSIMVYHNVVLRTWGIGTFPSIERHIMHLNETGFFKNSPMVDADGTPSFMRYNRSPAGRLLHILPAGLWSIIIPFQLSPTFRKQYRALHRWMGRLFIAMSVSMAVSVPIIVVQRASKVHYGILNAGVTTVVVGYFLVTALLGIYYAREKKMALHRVWILRHVGVGQSFSMLRLLTYSFGGVLGYFVPSINDHTEAGADLRSYMFTGTLWFSIALCVGSMEVWLKHTSASSKKIA